MARKLIVCFDGTGNEIEKKESNVLRLYKCLEHSADQMVYYEPGVGTGNSRKLSGGFLSTPRRILGLIAGNGLEANVLHAFDFLCNNYRKGDQLYFFGYSRGAYTARVLAGFINDFGLVASHETHLVAPVFKAWRKLAKGDPRRKYAPLRIYEQFFHVTHPSIRFLGLWDTVSSLIRIRLRWGTFIEFGTHSSVDINPSVQAVRHALAIDETRRYFRHQFWSEGEPFLGARKRPKKAPKNKVFPVQDVKQVWFPGTHTDIAGSLPESEAGLPKISMHWMRQELDNLDNNPLKFRDDYYNRYVLGKADEITKEMGLEISPPSAIAPIHSQIKKGWFVVEIIPRLTRRCRWPNIKGLFGYYLPLAQPRYIPPDANIHSSVYERAAAPECAYFPPNLPGLHSAGNQEAADFSDKPTPNA